MKNIFSELIKNRNTVILFVENEQILTSEKRFSARGAAINGFIQLVNQHHFILDKNNKIKIDLFKKTLKEKKSIIFFGFTSDIWIYLLQELKKRDINLRRIMH